MINEENYQNLNTLIGKTISDIHWLDINPYKTSIRFLTTDGNILGIDIEGDEFIEIIPYVSLGDGEYVRNE
jgi:hypothetical protein